MCLKLKLREKAKTYYIDLVKNGKKGIGRTLFSILLFLFSFIYGFFVQIILFCYRTNLLKTHKLDCPVISVGNITWGGTGKTPLVELLAKFFRDSGLRPVVLIRGYGKDEVDMLKDSLGDIPVLVGKDRVKTASLALRLQETDRIILDDGFQYWRLFRDINVVLIDATYPFGNRRLIPRGILREPLSCLKRADIFVLTKSNLAQENKEAIKQELRHYNSRAAIFEAEHRPIFFRKLGADEKIDLAFIKTQRVGQICAIADPQAFTKTIEQLNAQVVLTFNFPDHYQYTKADLTAIVEKCRQHRIQYLITTEKDLPKLTAMWKQEKFALEILVLCIEFKFIKAQTEFFSYFTPNHNKQAQWPYSILVLSDGKAGHLNQSRALAKLVQRKKTTEVISGAKVSTQVVEVRFKNVFCRFLLNLCSIFSRTNCRSCLCCLRFCLKKDCWQVLSGLTADVIISAGASLAGVNLFLSYKYNARNIILMRPSLLGLNRFDLVIIPEHDQVKASGNVLITRMAPNLIDQQYLEEQARILQTKFKIPKAAGEPNAGPTIGVLIGGEAAKYKISKETMEKIVWQLKEAALNLNCQLLISTSRRTSKEIEDLLKESLSDFSFCKLLVIANEKSIPEAVGAILFFSDIVLVSGESVSMVSEALSAEKYVLVFIPEKKLTVQTKQERFLKKLEAEQILKIVHPDELLSEIELIWKKRPPLRKIQDQQLIYQALSKIV